MGGYKAFADYYDILTQDIPYQKYGEYFNALLKQNNINNGILLDLACGTGSLSEAMAALGYDVIGVDSSTEMLSVAQNKKYNSGADILYLCQDMSSLDLYGTIDCCISALDSINHLTDKAALQMAFDGVSLFLRKDGIFIFDVNTIYKHEQILANQAFVYDYDEVYCVWQNSGCHDGIVDFSLDIFGKEGDCYYKSSESFSERAYSEAELEEMLEKAGLEIVARYGEYNLEPPKSDEQRIVFVTKKV